jgi:hypothetical protein
MVKDLYRDDMSEIYHDAKILEYAKARLDNEQQKSVEDQQQAASS